jgi:hypothetical protein
MAGDAISEMQEAQKAADANVQVATATVVQSQPWSQQLVLYLSAEVLGFTLIALLLATALLWKAKFSAHHVLRVFGILSILAFSAVLLVVGYSNEQLTPIVGLFGAIAGYLLGKEASPPAAGQKVPS